jgi:hypothetical protein
MKRGCFKVLNSLFFTLHFSLFTVHRSPFTVHRSPLHRNINLRLQVLRLGAVRIVQVEFQRRGIP